MNYKPNIYHKSSKNTLKFKIFKSNPLKLVPIYFIISVQIILFIHSTSARQSIFFRSLGCSSSPCTSNGVCQTSGSSYTCLCEPGYTGTHCEIDKNECDSNPCQNGSECIDLLNKWYCQCLSGYNGLTCQYSSNACDSMPCKNGGNCQTNGINQFLCNCMPGYIELCKILVY